MANNPEEKNGLNSGTYSRPLGDTQQLSQATGYGKGKAKAKGVGKAKASTSKSRKSSKSGPQLDEGY